MIKTIIRLLLGQRRSPAELVIRQVVERSVPEVSQLVAGRLSGMTLSEARGYVRARATQIVMREARLVIADSVDVEISDLAEITRQATERLIPLVIRNAHISARQAPRVAA